MPANITKKSDSGRTPRPPVEQIWLAGLGALAITEEEGTKLFRSLVKRGYGFEKETRERLGEVLSATTAAPGEAITRLEAGVTDTMTTVLRRLGVPTRREINNLTRRVEGLATTLERRPVRRRSVAAKTRTARPRRRAATASSTTA